MISRTSNENLLKVKFSNIQWDIDEEDFPSDEKLVLPQNFTVDIPVPEDNDTDLSDYLSDWLSNEYGFCHNGFNYQVINGDDKND
jgi:hypothetical protein